MDWPAADNSERDKLQQWISARHAPSTQCMHAHAHTHKCACANGSVVPDVFDFEIFKDKRVLVASYLKGHVEFDAHSCTYARIHAYTHTRIHAPACCCTRAPILYCAAQTLMHGSVATHRHVKTDPSVMLVTESPTELTDEARRLLPCGMHGVCARRM